MATKKTRIGCKSIRYIVRKNLFYRITGRFLTPGALRLPHHIYNRHLSRRKKAEGRTPGARAAADIERGAFAEGVDTFDEMIEDTREKDEREHLAAMKVAGELEVEKAQTFRVHVRAM